MTKLPPSSAASKPAPISVETILEQAAEWGFIFDQNRLARNPLILASAIVQQYLEDCRIIIEHIIAEPSGFVCHQKIKKLEITVSQQHRLIHLPVDPNYVQSRPDGIIGDDGFKVLELNIDSAIGGIAEYETLRQVVATDGSYNGLSVPSSREAYSRYFARVMDTIPHLPRSIVFVVHDHVDRTEYADLKELGRWLEADVGVRVGIEEARCLTAQGDLLASSGGERYGVAVRAFSMGHPTDTIRSTVKLVLSDKVQTLHLNPPVDLLLDDKWSLAILWASQKHLMPKLRQAVRRVIPRTVTHHADGWFDNRTEEVSRSWLAENKNRLVIKSIASRSGNDVRIGCENQIGEWLEWIDHAISKWGVVVAQEMITSTKSTFEFHGEGRRGGIFSTTVSPFFFGPEYGGSFVRIANDPLQQKLSSPLLSDMSGAVVASPTDAL